MHRNSKFHTVMGRELVAEGGCKLMVVLIGWVWCCTVSKRLGITYSSFALALLGSG